MKDTENKIEQIDDKTIITYAVSDLSPEEEERLREHAEAFIKSHVETSGFSSEDYTENNSRAVEY